MIYDCSNTRRDAQIYDVDTKEEIRAVIQIDTDSGEMLMYTVPITIDTNTNEAEVVKVKYRTISPIFGGYPVPCLFHCYGRLWKVTMTLRINHNSGKGSNRRATQNDEAYRNNYDSIFGKKTKGEPQVPNEDKLDATDVTDSKQDQDKP